MPQEKPQEAYLLRNPNNDKQTLGVFITQDGIEMWTCKTIELPWLDNEPGKSCIPAGRHFCKVTYSPKHNDYQHEIIVAGRTGLRFDVVNYSKDLLGCIGMGAAHKDINADSKLDVVHSGDTIKKFREIMGGKDFWLNVVYINEVKILAS